MGKHSKCISNITPGTTPKKRFDAMHALENRPAKTSTQAVADSDEDATFNEMMGKFDESYCYEKETDILRWARTAAFNVYGTFNPLSHIRSDSDPTECVSDLDTGLDGGDECETDDPLEIDYIDTASVQEIVDNAHVNTGSCSYHHQNGASPKQGGQSVRRTLKKQTSEELSASMGGGQQRRRKRLTRTRKNRTREGADGGSQASSTLYLEAGKSRRTPSNDRGTRSAGGTPVSLRRNKAKADKW